jgi:dUTP pyrophosphatase
MTTDLPANLPVASRQAESRKRPAIDPTDDSSPAKRGGVFGQKLACKKLSDKATLPSRGSAWAAGYDLSSAEDKIIPAKGRALIKTDIAIAVPLGTYGRVAPRCVRNTAREHASPRKRCEIEESRESREGTDSLDRGRSGLALKKGIDVGAGVIDADYRGNVGVILFNLGDEDFKVATGDRIAQLILECIVTPEVPDPNHRPDSPSAPARDRIADPPNPKHPTSNPKNSPPCQ